MTLGAALARRAGPSLAGAAIGGSIGAVIAVAVLAPTTSVLLAGAALFGVASVAAVAALLGGVRRVLMAGVVVDATLQLDTHLFYRASAAEFGALGGLNVSVTTLCLLGLYALWTADALARPRVAPRLRLAPAVPAALYVTAVVAVTPFAADTTLAVFEVWLLAQMLLLFVYLVATVRTRGDVVFVVAVLLGSLAVQGAVTVVTGVARRTFEVFVVSTTIDPSYHTGRIWRAGGTIGSPNAAAAFFVLLIAPALAVVLTQRRSWLTLLAGSSLAIGLAGLLVTRSRGGIIALVVSLGIVVVALLVERALAASTVRRTLLLGALVVPAVLPLALGRFVADDGGAAASRGPLNAIAFAMISDRPLTGVGPNNFAHVFRSYVGPEHAREWLYTVHNKYLLVWSESGPLALVTFVGFLVAAVLHARLAYLRTRGLVAVLALGLGAALVGQAVHMSVDIFNARPNVQMQWVVAALLAVLATHGRAMTDGTVRSSGPP